MAPPSLPRPSRFWPALLTALAIGLGYVLSLELRNPRLVLSWHGFVHVAIAERFPSSGLVPENPFYAGQPLAYYWVYQWIGAGLGRLLGISPLGAFQLIGLLSLVVLILAGIRAGQRYGRSAWAGALIAAFALVGANPAGPLLVAVRSVTQHPPLLQWSDGPGSSQAAVSDVAADQMMSRPLLPALYFGGDWRSGQNIVWFFDISSRAPALAALLLLLLVLPAAGSGAGAWVGALVATLAVTALNPIVGLAVAGALAGSLCLLALWRAWPRREWAPLRQALLLGCVIGAGAAMALPTFAHLLGHGGAGGISTPAAMLQKVVMTAMLFCLLGPLALLGALRVRGPEALAVRAMALTGAGLAGLAILVRLAEGNQHNLVNAAQVLLAIPAVLGLLPRDGDAGIAPEAVRRRLTIAGLLLLPMAAGTWLAFDGRPALPLARGGGALARTPPTDPVAALERWVRDSTPASAVLVADPDTALKMACNVSELPALTGRVLYTDQPHYLSDPYPDAAERRTTARNALRGALGAEDRSRLASLARPLYLVSREADRDGQALTAAYGPARFRAGPVGVWRIDLGAVRPSGI